ncbi:MAG: hypothetical protein RLZZ519_3170 [Bacteroidota bacterium]|jgi:uncharacterized protein (TIGR02452 family)
MRPYTLRFSVSFGTDHDVKMAIQTPRWRRLVGHFDIRSETKHSQQMSRTERAKIAEQTVEILKRKTYSTAAGRKISIEKSLDACLNGTKVFHPDAWPNLMSEVQQKIYRRPQGKPVTISVFAETTFRTCQRWVVDQNLENVACLNFASAKNPGGGFLGGSQAQEEALSRASGLYASLLRKPEYYEFNRKTGTCLYSDYMIWSPQVPIFRNDFDELLDVPYCASIITAPAVNAGCIRQNEPKKASEIKRVMVARAEKVLALAVAQDVENLVLGAWGCGVFANDPKEVAEIFAGLLRAGGPYARAFTNVAFSIPSGGSSQENWKAFSNMDWG